MKNICSDLNVNLNDYIDLLRKYNFYLDLGSKRYQDLLKENNRLCIFCVILLCVSIFSIIAVCVLCYMYL